jgi:peptide/nickel transport system permease protein
VAAYVLRRMLWGLVLLVLVSLLTFVVFYVLPSADPAQLRAGRNASPATLAQIRESLGLDRPVTAQYWTFLSQLGFHANLGYSYFSQASVGSLLVDRLPATISLTLGAIVIWVLVAVPLGVVAATRRGTWVDKLTTGGALLGISAPVYWLGLVALYLFADDIGIWPVFQAPAATCRSPTTRGSGSRRSSCRGSCSPRPSPPSTRACCAAT